ncbi:MAG: toprim domain-containing protein [Bacteroidales bacterium]|nr:toprim domain-containing protein [Bacteroidales bacterium]
MVISKEKILSATTSCEILNHYLAPYNHSRGRLIPGKHISNPFLSEKQKTPSFNIYYSHISGEWRYKDFATNDDGSCFDLVMNLNNLSFNDALHHINNEMCLNLCTHSDNTAFTPTLHPSDKTIQYGTSSLILKPFSLAELDWWKQYGISEVVLKQFKVSSAKAFSAINKSNKEYKIDSTPENPIFVYVSDKWAKIYRPFESKYRFQYLGEKPSDYIFGINQLPDMSEYIFITGGEKDVMSLAAHGYTAISLNSETAFLPQDVYTMLRSRCRFLIILYDNDSTGFAQGEKLAKSYNLPCVTLPPMNSGKDISDYFKLGLPYPDLQKLFVDACSSYEPLSAPTIAPSRLDRLLITQEKLKENKSKKITFSNPILSQNEMPVFYPNTINVIQGKAGMHKSRLAQIISSALLKKNDEEDSLLGFKKDFSKSYAICYVDTERNHSEQLPYALQQIQIKAGYNIEEHPENFDYISLLEFERKMRFDVLNEYLEHLRTKYKRHIFIILDVITDCVYNFNDPKDSMALIDMMNISINHYDVTFLCVIHENPGSADKARGHLGTEIMNKASTVIQVGYERDRDRKETDLIKVAYLKCRSTRKYYPFFAKYSETDSSLVLVEGEALAAYEKDGKKSLDVNSVIAQLEIILNTPLSRKEVINNLTSVFKCSVRFIEDYLKQIFEEKSILMDSHNQKCNLDKSRDGRAITYFLNPINIQQSVIEMPENFINTSEDDAPF